MLKFIDKTIVKMIHKLMEKIWNTKEIPKYNNKKDDKRECNNYRGIALVNVTYKTLSYCILNSRAFLKKKKGYKGLRLLRKLIELIKVSLKNTVVKFNVGNVLLSEVQVNKGLQYIPNYF